MSLPWLLVLIDLVAWMSIWLLVDSPAVPVWKTRNAYRLFICWLLLRGWLLAWRAEAWHAELTALMPHLR